MVLMDAILTGASFILAYLIKFYIFEKAPGIGVLPLSEYIMLLPFMIPGYLLLYSVCGVYSPKRAVKRRYEVSGVLQSNTIGIAALIVILYVVIREINYSRSVIGLFYILNSIIYALILQNNKKNLRVHEQVSQGNLHSF